MKAIVLAASAVFGFVGGAQAADAVVEEVVIVDTAYDWSGVYVGGALGYQILRGADNFSLIEEGVGAESDGGFAGAIYAGANFQSQNWVFGVEADVKFSDAEPDDGVYLRLKTEVAGSVRGRVGYSFGNILPYFTAGLAIGRFEDDHEGDGNPEDIVTETLTGYAVGGGVEWGATENLIVRAEYIFSDYGTSTFDFYDGSDPHEVEVESHDFRIGVAYKF